MPVVFQDNSVYEIQNRATQQYPAMMQKDIRK